jgi:hypothetical protein
LSAWTRRVRERVARARRRACSGHGVGVVGHGGEGAAAAAAGAEVVDRIGSEPSAARCRWTSAPRRMTPRSSATSAATVRPLNRLFDGRLPQSQSALRPAGILKDLLKPDKDKETKSSWKVLLMFVHSCLIYAYSAHPLLTANLFSLHHVCFGREANHHIIISYSQCCSFFF